MSYDKVDKNTVLFSEGDVATKMYLLMSGSCDALDGAGNHIAAIESVSVFGEYGVIGGNRKRTATIRTVTNCEILSLAKKDFDLLKLTKAINKECITELLKIAKEREAENNKLLQVKKKK